MLLVIIIGIIREQLFYYYKKIEMISISDCGTIQYMNY